MTARSGILKLLIHNAWGELLSRLPVLVAQLIIARVLGPSIFGIWVFIQLLVNYNNLSSFGLNSAMSREEPIALGQKKSAEASLIRSTVFSYTMSFSLLLALLVILLAIFFPSNFFDQHKSILILVALILLAQQLFIFFQTTFQNNLLFFQLSCGKVIYGVFYLLLIVATVTNFGVCGLLFSWLLSFCFAVVYYIFSKKIPFPTINLNKQLLLKLLKIGFPLYCAALLKLGVSSVDRILIGLFLGSKLLGYYSVSMVLIMCITVLSGLVSRVASPHFLTKIGEGSTNDEIFLTFVKIISRTNWLVSAVVILMILFFYPFVAFILPKFLPGLLAGAILIFVGYFAGVVQFFYVLLTALKLYKSMLFSAVISILLYFFSFLVLYYSGVRSIAIYAVLDLAVWALYYFMLTRKISLKVSSNISVHFVLFYSVLVPFIVSFIVSMIPFLTIKAIFS